MRKLAALLFAVLLPLPGQAASDVSSPKAPSPKAYAQATGLGALIGKPVHTMQEDSAGVLKIDPHQFGDRQGSVGCGGAGNSAEFHRLRPADAADKSC